jgi:hypothetical protein
VGRLERGSWEVGIDSGIGSDIVEMDGAGEEGVVCRGMTVVDRVFCGLKGHMTKSEGG